MLISAPDFEKEVLPHDPWQCMECAIPILKTHRVATSLSIESTDDSITRPHSHTSDSIDSNTSSPVLTAKFKVGSVKSDESKENGMTDTESVDRKLKLRNGDEDKRPVEIHSQMNGTRSRSHSNSPLVRMKRIYNSESDNHNNNPQTSTVGNSDIEEKRATTEHVENSGTPGGYSPSTSPEQGCAEEEEEAGGVSEPDDQPSRNQIESPTRVILNEDDDMVEGSPSSEEITSHRTSSSADRLEVKKDELDVTSSSNSSTSARGSGGTGTGGDEASSSTQSSETKDVTTEVLINVVPSR